MRALVAYMSKTGNTRKIAEAIYGELSCEKELRPIGEVRDLGGYDIAFLGFPVHQFGPDKETKEILSNLGRDGRKVALFITHASPESAPQLSEWLAKFKEAASGANVVGMFDCQGQLSKNVERMLKIMPSKEMRFFAKNHNSQGQPDEQAVMRARAFARDTLSAVSK